MRSIFSSSFHQTAADHDLDRRKEVTMHRLRDSMR